MTGVNASILIVDDRADNLVAYRAILEPLGQKLVEAGSGEEALRRLLEEEFAVILLDIQMPGLDGYDTAALIKERPRTRDVPIIFITAIDRDQEHALRGYATGAVDFIAKPVDPFVLRSKVAVFVELHKKSTQLETELEQRRRAEAELARLNVELERSNSELTSFAGVASHDLQEPLHIVSGFLQLLEETEGHLSEDGRSHIARCLAATDRMRTLIRDILEYSRVQPPRDPVAVSMEMVLDEALLNVEGRVKEAGAVIVRSPLPVVSGDAAQLCRLWQNLIANALKFRTDRPPRIEISSRARQDMHEFGVSDNGIGIDELQLPDVFRMFYRGHAREHYEGTGIGLALCKKIVELHGGRIWAESAPGAGTTFLFELPRLEHAG